MATQNPTRDMIRFVDDFDRAQALTTTPGYNGWTIKDTSSAGTPTYLAVTENGGAMKLTMAATSEAEIVTMYQNDVLMLDLANLQDVEFVLKVAGFDSVTDVLAGVATAQNDTYTSMTNYALFHITGATPAAKVSTTDAVTVLTDKTPSVAMSTNYHRFNIDFTKGLTDVRFFIDGNRVCSATTFDMSGITADQNVQPFFQIQKASGTGVGALTIARFISQQSFVYQ